MQIHNPLKKDFGSYSRWTYTELWEKLKDQLSNDELNFIAIDDKEDFPSNLSVIKPPIIPGDEPAKWFKMYLSEIKANAFDEVYKYLPTWEDKLQASDIRRQLQEVGFSGLSFFDCFVDMPARSIDVKLK